MIDFSNLEVQIAVAVFGLMAIFILVLIFKGRSKKLDRPWPPKHEANPNGLGRTIRFGASNPRKGDHDGGGGGENAD